MKFMVADLEAFQNLESNFTDIGEQLTSAERRLSLSPSNGQILEAVTQLFTSVLHFLVQSTQFLRAKKSVRAWKALAGGNDKLKRMFYDIQQRSASLDRVAGIVEYIRESMGYHFSPLRYITCASKLLLTPEGRLTGKGPG